MNRNKEICHIIRYQCRIKSNNNIEWKKMTVLEDGTRYEGEWDIDSKQRCGFGIYVWTDGSLYEGMIKNGKAHGLGRLIHADGDVYEGEFVKGKREGQGKLTYATGQVSEGKWLNGILVAAPETAPEPEPAPAPTEPATAQPAPSGG